MRTILRVHQLGSSGVGLSVVSVKSRILLEFPQFDITIKSLLKAANSHTTA